MSMQKVARNKMDVGLHGERIAMRHVNRPITENFITKVIWEMIDSSIKNLGEVEYDK